MLAGIRKALPNLLWQAAKFSLRAWVSPPNVFPALIYSKWMRKIPFKGEFDVIGAFDVLEHIADDQLVLSQMYQALRDGGGILLPFRNMPFFGARSTNTRNIPVDIVRRS